MTTQADRIDPPTTAAALALLEARDITIRVYDTVRRMKAASAARGAR